MKMTLTTKEAAEYSNIGIRILPQKLLHHRHGVFDLPIRFAGTQNDKALMPCNGVLEALNAIRAGAG